MHPRRGGAVSVLHVAMMLLRRTDAFSVRAPSTIPADVVQRAKEEHVAQFTAGADVFGYSSDASDAIEGGVVRPWSDEDFRSYDIGLGNGGPSEYTLLRGHEVLETLEPVLSEAECDVLVRTAREAIAAGRASEAKGGNDPPSADGRSWERSNSQLGEARLSALPPQVIKMLRSILQERLYPLLESRFGVSDLTVYDGLILGSIAPSISQPVHRDASLLTLNVALSKPTGFTGGGTYIEGSDSGLPLLIEQGAALCHSSGVMHAGTAIDSGERWVMVLFVLAWKEPQIARRCHAEGLMAMDEGNLDVAAAAFEAGLSVAPRDHLLHMGLGQVYSMRGNKRKAFDRLNIAADCYPLSQKALIGMGKMLLAERRPRAALRRFDKALESIAGRDLMDGAWMPLKAAAWDARVTAARCALLCAEREASKGGERSWSNLGLPEAIERLRLAIIAAPQDERLHHMLGRAEELLKGPELQ